MVAVNATPDTPEMFEVTEASLGASLEEALEGREHGVQGPPSGFLLMQFMCTSGGSVVDVRKGSEEYA